MLPLSAASLIAVLSVIISSEIKNRIIAYIIIGINVFLIIKLGKISAISTIALVLSFSFILTRAKRITNLNILKFIVGLFYIPVFFFSFILVYLKDEFNDNFIRLITFRDEIYSEFIKYTIQDGRFIFGNGFINNEVGDLLLHSNPHNQALGVFFTLGFFGLVMFLLFFLKILGRTLEEKYRFGGNDFDIFIALSLLMMMDSYFVLTVFPVQMVFFIFYLTKQ